MSKYAEYMRSIDNNRTIYDFGEVGASVTYDVELNQTEKMSVQETHSSSLSSLAQPAKKLSSGQGWVVHFVDGNGQESIDEILTEIKETDIDFALATESISEGIDLTALQGCFC